MNDIPKVIHYIWFGHNPKPDIVLNCIASWEKYFPDFQIIEWNEENYDINKNAFIQEAYSCKKWAFVSDYVRFDVLNQYGGLYFDTDVEVIRQFPSDFFEKTAFTGVESTNIVSPGLVFGCVPKLNMLSEILAVYDRAHFLLDGKECPITVNARVTELLQKYGFVPNGEYQKIADIEIYPSEYFCGFDLDVFEPCITENTLSMHHYASSWENNSFRRKRKMQSVLKK